MTAATTILSADVTIVDVPLRRAHQHAGEAKATQPLALVRVRLAGGAEGLGEGATPQGPWWGGEAVEGMAQMLRRYLLPAAIGTDAAHPAGIARRLDRIVAGNPFAKNALHAAVMDAASRQLGVPLATLLGGNVRERVACRWALSGDSMEADVAEARKALGSGRFAAFKIKAGHGDVDADVARIEALADALPNARLSVDANQRWSLPDAARALRRLAAVGVEFVEQPVPHAAAAALARMMPDVPLMADEAIWNAHDVAERVGPYAALSVKAGKAGGPLAAMTAAAIASAHGRALYAGTAIETAYGTASALQLAAALPEPFMGSEFFGPFLLADDIARQPLAFGAGAFTVPNRPGNGLEFDESAIRRMARR